ncbi:MAG TPA: DUF3068 domain-containing protein [Streptosporangiaceae bacterium]
MRRAVGLALAGFGAFLIVVAVILPTYISGQIVKFPLNEYETITLTGTGASYLSPVTLTEVKDASLRATETIKGDAGSGDGSTAVWDEFTYIVDTARNQPVLPMTRVFAFDRQSAELVQCCGESVDGQPDAQTGIAGYVFPIGTRKHTYQVYDAILGRAVPFAYTGTAVVHGVKAYLFEGTVAPADIGITPLSATEREYYSGSMTYWVDPETGLPLKLGEHEDEYLVHPATGARAATVFDANLTTTPATVRGLVASDQESRHKLSRFRLLLPVTAGTAGLVALVAGVVLAVRTARNPDADPVPV